MVAAVAERAAGWCEGYLSVAVIVLVFLAIAPTPARRRLLPVLLPTASALVTGILCLEIPSC
jgi:hypothetical protein